MYSSTHIAFTSILHVSSTHPIRTMALSLTLLHSKDQVTIITHTLPHSSPTVTYLQITAIHNILLANLLPHTYQSEERRSEQVAFIRPHLRLSQECHSIFAESHLHPESTSRVLCPFWSRAGSVRVGEGSAHLPTRQDLQPPCQSGRTRYLPRAGPSPNKV